MDPQAIELFRRWQRKTGKYPDLDIEKVEFGDVPLKHLHQSNLVKTVKTTTANKFIEIGDIDRKTKKYDIRRKTKNKLPEKAKHAPKGTILVSRVRPLLGGYTIIDGHDYTFTSGDLNPIVLPEAVDVNYVFKIICSSIFKNFLIKNQDTAGQKPTITKKLYDFEIPLPHDYNEKYNSKKIQQAIVEFLDYRLGLTRATRKQVDSIREKVELMDKIMLPKIFEMKDPWLRGQFNKWAELKGYDIGVDDLQFYEIGLSNQEYFQFIKGKNAYIKKYNLSHPGKIPLATGSVKNNGIGYYVEPIDESHIIKEESVSFNKDGDTKAFYRDYPYLMDRHHIAIIPTKGKIAAKYLFFVMDLLFKNADYNWGEHTANAEEVAKNNIKVPKPTKRYSSYQVQQMLVEFYSAFERFRDKLFGHIDRVHQKVDKLDEATIARIFKRNV